MKTTKAAKVSITVSFFSVISASLKVSIQESLSLELSGPLTLLKMEEGVIGL